MDAATLLNSIKANKEKLKLLESSLADLAVNYYPTPAADNVKVQASYTDSKVEQLAIKKEALKEEYANTLGAWVDNMRVLNDTLCQLSSPRQMRIIHLVYCLGYTPAAAAAELGCSKECIYTNITNAKRSLDKLLK